MGKSSKYALKFGYFGKDFSGSARQPDLRTIEGEMIKALEASRIIEDYHKANVQIASRTDKGVSALGNVISLETNFREEEIISALNSHLEQIWFYGMVKVTEDFNPRHAKTRFYRYYLALEECDIQIIKDTAKLFTGEHDFSNFARIESGVNPKRTIDKIEVFHHGGMLVLDFHAQSFLWHMIRRIVNALAECANNRCSVEDIKNALECKEKIDLGIASPEPLVLMDIDHGFEFIIDKEALKKLKRELEYKLQSLNVEGLLYKGIIDKISK